MFNLDSLFVPRVFTFQNEINQMFTYSMQKTTKVDSGYILFQKRYTDSFDIDSTIQFISESFLNSNVIEDYWFYYIDNKRYSCKAEQINASEINYINANDHFTKIIYEQCDKYVPHIVEDKAIFIKEITINLNGNNIECLQYKAQAKFTDISGRFSKRTGYTYLGKDLGVIKFSNSSSQDKSNWVLKSIKKL